MTIKDEERRRFIKWFKEFYGEGVLEDINEKMSEIEEEAEMESDREAKLWNQEAFEDWARDKYGYQTIYWYWLDGTNKPMDVRIAEDWEVWQASQNSLAWRQAGLNNKGVKE